MESIFVTISLTYHVLNIVHGVDCAVIVMPVAMPRILPSKLYGVACNPAHVSFALVMFNTHVVHSYQELLLNVKVGEVAS